MLAVRARALEQFSDAAIHEGDPMALLEDTLVPVYLFHRYQTEAAVKVIGGQTYTYALRGDGQTPTTPIPAGEQRRALEAVLRTIAPETLAIPDRIAALIPPHPAGYERTRESFNTHTGMTFDPLAAAESAAHQSISLLLDPERAARLVAYHGQDPSQLGLGEVLDRLIEVSWKAKPSSDKLAAVQRATADVALNDIMVLATNDHAATEVRATAFLKVMQLKDWLNLQAASATDEPQRAHLLFAAAQIRKFEQEPAQVLKSSEPLALPPGAPIGSRDGDKPEQ
jgi:hypothetical protein